MQRKLETALRHQKDRSSIAKAANDPELRLDAQSRINNLKSQYVKFSDAAGLDVKTQRMSASGYHKIKTD